MTVVQGRFRQLSILVVEDEALIALEIQNRLTRLGFNVAGVTDSGEQAILAAQGLSPDLILMDIRLKGEMDGVEAAGRIRQGADIPVVFLTAHSDSTTLQRAKESGPYGYVIKPFQEKDLLVAIELAIHRNFLEQRLKESERKYAATLDSIGDGVVATDAEGRVTYLNHVAEALTGWKLADAEGIAVEQVFELVQEDRRTVMENPVRRVLREGAVIQLREPALLVAGNHDLIPVDDSAAPIKTDRGNVIGAVVAFRDIRERRSAEDALRSAEQQLRQSQKMEAIGRLAGGLAHDFNNLLTVINGYCELLLHEGSLNENSVGRVQDIHNAGKRAASLTGQLLAFSRKQMLSPVAMDLNARVASIESLLHRLIGEDIILTCILGKKLHAVKADPSQMEQVLMNLAVNARDSMSKGGQLTIETSNVELDEIAVADKPEITPGRYVMLAVSDTGCGFDDTIKANLFEPFFTTKELGKGTGLGLATVYGIVKQSLGFIYVYSEPGVGSTFKVYLPAIVSAVSDLALDKSLNPSDWPPQGTETILLVEDEEQVRRVSSSILETLGYTVLQAGDGEQAIQISEQFEGEINLIVTDVVMPRMGGPQLAEHLESTRPGIPVLYLSGYTDEAVFRHGILEKKAAFLQKPYTSLALAEKVRQSLIRRTLDLDHSA